MDRTLASLEGVDPVRRDVSDHDVVTELRETGGGHEADPAGSDDTERLSLHARPAYVLPSGCMPRAIASMVSLESLFRSVFTTQ